MFPLLINSTQPPPRPPHTKRFTIIREFRLARLSCGWHTLYDNANHGLDKTHVADVERTSVTAWAKKAQKKDANSLISLNTLRILNSFLELLSLRCMTIIQFLLMLMIRFEPKRRRNERKSKHLYICYPTICY